MGFGDDGRAGLALSFPARMRVGLVFTIPAIPSLISSLEV